MQIVSRRKLISRSRTSIPGSKSTKTTQSLTFDTLKNGEDRCKDAVALLKKQEYTPVKLAVRNKIGDLEDHNLIDTEAKSKVYL